jgi:hypothetical protein
MGHKQPQGRGGRTANVDAVAAGVAEERGTNIGIALSGVKQNVESTSQIVSGQSVRIFVHQTAILAGDPAAGQIVTCLDLAS